MADSAPQKRKIVESDSDSDDDVPLSELRNKVAIKKEPKNDVTKSSPPSCSSSSVTVKEELGKSAAVKPTAADDSDDSDDDVPIAVLMKRKQEAALAAKKAASPAKKAKVVVKPSASSSSVKKSSTPSEKKIVPSNKKSASSSSSGGTAKKIQGDPLESSQLTESFYTTLDKGKLCQSLLRRWWYALSWPQEGVMKLCPKGYEPLNGFPGVFVGTTVREGKLGMLHSCYTLYFSTVTMFS